MDDFIYGGWLDYEAGCETVYAGVSGFGGALDEAGEDFVWAEEAGEGGGDFFVVELAVALAFAGWAGG